MNDSKIKLIMPVVSDSDQALIEYLNEIKEPNTQLALVTVKGGVESIESYYDASIATPYILKEVESAGEEGFDAVTILCGTDPALNAAKEVADVLVVGILEAAIHTACVLGRKFSLLTVLPRTVGNKHDKIGEMGLIGRCASIVPLGVPVLELHKNRDRLIQVLIEKASLAVERDQADTIVLTCVGMFDVAGELSQRIGIPVLEPAACGVKWCEMLLRMRHLQSRKAFPLAR